MDKKIGLITAKLQADGLDQNTIIIFAGDNGTASFVTSIFDNQEFDGAKGQTTEAGTHVPLIAWWPGHIAAGSVNDDLVDFTDFFPTLADASNTTDLSSYGAMDGKSFYPRLLGQAGNPRDWIFDHVTARPGFSLPARRWVQNKTYKLYDTTVFPDSKKFYNIVNDRLEVNPLPDSVLTADEIATKNYFQSILDTMPHPPATPGLDSAFAFNITNSSATIGGRVVSDGGSALKERGSLISTYQNPAYYIFGRLPDSLAILGTFQQNRTKLKPQTSYNYSLYAMNNNNSYNTGFVRVNPAFITCSSPPLAQPLSFTAKAASCSVDLRWGAARFPKSGATQAGYLIVYSTQTPSLKADPNRKYPNRIVSTGSIALVGPTNMPVTPAQTDTIGGLSPDSVYHFLIVPYTWNGTDTTTYIYLTAGALTATSSVLASKMAVGLTAQKLLCANDNSGIITASASRGKAPYLYSINAGSFGSASVFNHLAAGRDTIAVKDAFGCSVTGSIAVTQPAVLSLLISRTNVSCKGASDGTVTLTGRGGTAPYLYSFNGGVYDTVSLFTGLAAGTYSLSVKDNNSCIFSSSVRLPQSTITCSPLWAPAGGSESLSMLSGLKVGIYPNPSQSQFSLMLTNVTSTKPVIIKVVDMYGKVRNSYTGVTNHTYTFGSGFVAGIYLVQVQQGNEVKTIKIIKSK